jgi:hypothetical protein
LPPYFSYWSYITCVCGYSMLTILLLISVCLPLTLLSLIPVVLSVFYMFLRIEILLKLYEGMRYEEYVDVILLKLYEAMRYEKWHVDYIFYAYVCIHTLPGSSTFLDLGPHSFVSTRGASGCEWQQFSEIKLPP